MQHLTRMYSRSKHHEPTTGQDTNEISEPLKMQQPDRDSSTSKSKVTTWTQTGDPRPPSDPGSFKTIIARGSESRIGRVLRPIRVEHDPSKSSPRSKRSSARASKKASTSTRMSRSSLMPNRENNRRPTISTSSRDIQIGLQNENSSYSDSDYDREPDSHWDETGSTEFLTRTHDIPSHHSHNTFGGRALSGFYAADTDTCVPPSPLPEAYLSKALTLEDYYEKAQPQERPVYPMPLGLENSPWTRRFTHYCSNILATLSIALPAAFLAVAVAISFANGNLTSSGWSAVKYLVTVAKILWPIILAVVVAQSLKAWITLKTGIDYLKRTQSGRPIKQLFTRSQLEIMCLLIFLSWCTAPIGTLALQYVYNINSPTQQTPINLWYIDRTGENEMWSPNSTSRMTTTKHSLLTQIIGERYTSLVFNGNNPSRNEMKTTSYPVPQSAVMKTTFDASPGAIDTTAFVPTMFSSMGSTVNPSTGDVGNHVLFELTTSYLDFSCGDWDLTTRSFHDYTVPSKMSYSTSQTLGMRMSTDYSSSNFSTGNVTISSLNAITAEGLGVLDEQWEYSSINCSWKQLFYNVPLRCSWDGTARLSNCVQYAETQPLLTHEGLSGTELGDFSNDFVLTGNIPTSERIATPTERYIQNGGPVQLNSFMDSAALLNLSETVTPNDFAQRFGHLFNTWVALGYCPQCSLEVVTANNTVTASDLKQFFRQTSLIVDSPGESFFDIDWAWVAVLLAFGIVLLIIGVTSVVLEPEMFDESSRRSRSQQPGHEMSSTDLPPPRRYSDVSPAMFPMPKQDPKEKSIRGSGYETNSRDQVPLARYSELSPGPYHIPEQYLEEKPVDKPEHKRNLRELPPLKTYSSISSGPYAIPDQKPLKTPTREPGHRRSPRELPPLKRYSAISPGPYSMPEDDPLKTPTREMGHEGSLKNLTPSKRFSAMSLGMYSMPETPSGRYSLPTQNSTQDPFEDLKNAAEQKTEPVSIRYSHIPPGRYSLPQQDLRQDLVNESTKKPTQTYSHITPERHSSPQPDLKEVDWTKKSTSEENQRHDLVSTRYSHIPPGRYSLPQQISKQDRIIESEEENDYMNELPSRRYSHISPERHSLQQQSLKQDPISECEEGPDRINELLSTRYSHIPPKRYPPPQQHL